MLAEVDGSYFELEGFGRTPWYVEVAYDMSAFLEQVRDLSHALRSHRAASVDLYGQGVESILEFEPRGDLVEIRCISRTDRTPDPPIELVDQSALLEMLTRLVRDVAHGLAMIEPELITQPPFDAWARGEV